MRVSLNLGCAIESLSQHELFQRRSVAEGESAGAVTADRAGGDIDRPSTVVVDAELDVNRSGVEANRMRGAGCRIDDGPLLIRWQPGWRDVDRLFEEGTIQWVGLVEEG